MIAVEFGVDDVVAAPHRPVPASRHVADVRAPRLPNQPKPTPRERFREWLGTWLIGDEPVDIPAALQLSRLDILDGLRVSMGPAPAPNDEAKS